MAFKGKLIISGNNAKTVKGDGDAFETAIMYLAPFTQAGVGNVCSMAALAACWKPCLNTAGRGAMNSVQAARVRKTKQYMTEREAFLAQLVDDLEGFSAYCKRKGIKPCVRLNGTSDIMFEKGHPVTRNGERFVSLMEAFPEVQFYDYTKIFKRVDKALPANYSLTLSYSSANAWYANEVTRRVRERKANMAVVYRTKEAAANAGVGSNWYINGDETDLRFLDPQGGYVVALYAKGRAKKDTSGFVVD